MNTLLEPVREEEKKTVKFKKDPLFSFIVPIYNLDSSILKRCLMSLQDQNYENKEIMCVLDGPNKELEDVVDFFLDDKQFKKLIIEHGGACKARNEGFKISSGEIVSFFNSDYIANPGMIRLWVDSLLKNPDCGFAYGGYEYTTRDRYMYPSKGFDPYLLNVANYIDCGFPLWRKYVVEWDENCKSLQDWDFWIRVVKTHGVKGYYLNRDVSFVAEPPRLNGLSHDSTDHWIDRVAYIKTKNGINKSDLVVTSIGAVNHGVEIAKLLKADFRDDTIYKPSNYKALYLIGFYLKPGMTHNSHANILANFPKSVKKIIHFVGADIYWLRKFGYQDMKSLSGALNNEIDHILCETSQARQELKDFGIESEIVPIPSYSDWTCKEMPKDFKVCIFLTNTSDFDKYCLENTLSIVRAMPDINFIAYGDGGREISYPNMEHKGNLTRKEWENLVYGSSCYLRLCRHDTLPMASTEFLMAGRDVVTNIPMSYVNYIDTGGTTNLNKWDRFQEGLNVYHWPQTKKKIVQKIREIKNKTILFDERKKISDFYCSMLDKEKYIQKIKGLYA